MNHETVIVVSVCVAKDGKFLLAKRAEDDTFMPGYWEIPGGKANFGEQLTDSAIREIKEELGIDIVPEHLLTIRHYPHESNPHKQYIALFYLGKMADEDQEICLSHEHSDYCWVDFDEAKQYHISPYTSKVLDEIINHPLYK